MDFLESRGPPRNSVNLKNSIDSIKFHGIHRIHSISWVPLDSSEFPWIRLKFHGFRETQRTWKPADSMKFHGILGVPRMLLNPSNPTEPRFSKSHGFHKGLRNPWNYGNVEIRGFHGSLESYGIPWNSSQHGNSKKLLEFYGIPTHRNHRMLEICEFHKNQWIPFTLGFHGVPRHPLIPRRSMEPIEW